MPAKFKGSDFHLPVMSVDLGFGDALYKYLDEIQSVGIYGNFGPQVTQLEQEFAFLLGVDRETLVSASNATVALMGAMTVLNVRDWTLPSWTFAATAHAALANRAEFSFADVSPRDWALSAASVAPGAGAIITAPFGSETAIGPEWNHAQAIVIDAAAAIGSPPRIASQFSKPWASVFSLHATKLLGIGEGALVVFSSPELADSFRMWTNFGFSGSRLSQIPALNGKMSEVHGAIGRHRLAAWHIERTEWLRSRALVHQIGSELGVNPPFSAPDWLSPYWIASFPSAQKKIEVQSALSSNGVETRDWWGAGCHAMPAFSHIRVADDLAVTESIASTSLGLPFFRGITDDALKLVGDVLADVLSRV